MSMTCIMQMQNKQNKPNHNYDYLKSCGSLKFPMVLVHIRDRVQKVQMHILKLHE